MGLDLSRVAEGARRLGGYSVVTLLTRKGDTTRSLRLRASGMLVDTSLKPDRFSQVLAVD